MKLEVISRRPAGATQPTPLLFVHGAYSGAWVWDQHFLPYFTARGYAAHAISLRGHGKSEGREQLLFARLRDYVADVEQVMATLDRPPVLIGHSMGGLVVQKILHRRPVTAAVLMASAPPHGMIPSMFGMAFTNPGLFRELALLQAFGPEAAGELNIRRSLFGDDTPDADVSRYMHRFQPESSLVVLDLMGLDLPPSIPSLHLPVLVLGASEDCFVFPSAIEATADTYRTQAEIFAGMAHAMMLDHHWRKVADRIAAWLPAALAGGAADGAIVASA
ncbi:MAG: alpha/beta fold hydrolase [Rhodospirillales bacterium]